MSRDHFKPVAILEFQRLTNMQRKLGWNNVWNKKIGKLRILPLGNKPLLWSQTQNSLAFIWNGKSNCSVIYPSTVEFHDEVLRRKVLHFNKGPFPILDLPNSFRVRATWPRPRWCSTRRWSSTTTMMTRVTLRTVAPCWQTMTPVTNLILRTNLKDLTDAETASKKSRFKF